MIFFNIATCATTTRLLVSGTKSSLSRLFHPVRRCQSEAKTPVQLFKDKLEIIAKLDKKNTGSYQGKKDVILYNHDSSKFFRLMNLFAVTQFGFWVYMGITLWDLKAVEIPADIKNNKDIAWFRKYDIAYYKIPMAITSTIIGCGVLVGCWMHIYRTVLHIVLRKGGNTVTFATHTPFGGAKFLTVPLEKVSAHTGRTGRVYASIKVQGRPLHYLIDTEGTFVRPALFDKTVGVKRSFT